jgi:pimeloyl-ACP methyl ester carboxylesterase
VTSRLETMSVLSDVDASDQPYAIYLPPRWSRVKKYPLVVSLHGAGTNHRINLRRVFGVESGLEDGTGYSDNSLPSTSVDYIVICPFARGSMGYQGVAEKDVYDVLADVQRRYRIDEDRIYLTGLSMGGGGTLWLGLTRPDIWAAVAPVAPKFVAPMAQQLAPNALNLGVHIFQGGKDRRSCVENSREWARRLRALETRVIDYTEYPDMGVPAWEYAYKDGAIFNWFQQFTRNRFPSRVRFLSASYKYASAYWVELTKLRSGVLAKIEAEFVGHNDLQITTEALGGFTLKLDGHPLYSSEHPLEIRLDGSQFCTNDLSFCKETGYWKVGRRIPLVGEKERGSEGPICEAFAGRHVYVYGTAGNPNQEEIQRRRGQATRAANWQNATWHLLLGSFLSSVAPPNVFFPVIPDRYAARKEYSRHSLILFGDRNTNSAIGQLSRQLPLELCTGAVDYGLVFVTFLGGRYIVVNSGIPWWTGANPSKRSGFGFLSVEQGVLYTFGDFLLFRGSLDNVIFEGRFDQNWRLSREDTTKVKETGVCTIPEQSTQSIG